jgi:hypothetical protein
VDDVLGIPPDPEFCVSPENSLRNQ